MDQIVAEAQAYITEQRGALDARTIAWLDQRSAALAADTSMAVLVEAWNQQQHTDDAGQWHRKEQFLARLCTAMAIVAKAGGWRPLE